MNARATMFEISHDNRPIILYEKILPSLNEYFILRTNNINQRYKKLSDSEMIYFECRLHELEERRTLLFKNLEEMETLFSSFFSDELYEVSEFLKLENCDQMNNLPEMFNDLKKQIKSIKSEGIEIFIDNYSKISSQEIENHFSNRDSLDEKNLLNQFINITETFSLKCDSIEARLNDFFENLKDKIVQNIESGFNKENDEVTRLFNDRLKLRFINFEKNKSTIDNNLENEREKILAERKLKTKDLELDKKIELDELNEEFHNIFEISKVLFCNSSIDVVISQFIKLLVQERCSSI